MKRVTGIGGLFFKAEDPEQSYATTYFDTSQSRFMITFRVDDLDVLLAALKEEGVEIDPKRETF